ncbi:MAG TPA: hypothetical protein VMV44_06410, partial [Rectinemataceae bacterium]|nr:hypothetical protein [Rectinemataceae bacterium]
PFRPAGAIWPDDLAVSSSVDANPRLDASWFGGWTASVLSALEAFGGQSGVDYARLTAEARSRLPDPWLVEPKKIAMSMVERSFRSDRLVSPPGIAVGLPSGGPWYAESPFAGLPEAIGDSYEALLATGYHCFHSSELELFVAVPEEGDAILLIRGLDPP